MTQNQNQALKGYINLAEKRSCLPKLGAGFIFICILLAFVKLWLVSGNEIFAVEAPHDHSLYARMANSLIEFRWLGDYNKFTLIRRPAYPLWIWLVNLTGVPLRIAMEFLLIFSGIAFAGSLIKARFPAWFCLCIYVCIIFFPQSFYMNDQLRSEAFYAPVLILGFSCLVMMKCVQTSKDRLFYAFLIGVAFAILWYTRREHALIAGFFGFWGLIELIEQFKQRVSWKDLIKYLSIVMLVPVSVVVCFSLTIASINYFKYGIFLSHDELHAPGFVAAHKALMRITNDRPRRFVAVPEDVRQRAYQVSPTFRELKPFLENDLKGWIQFGCQASNICDDYANGWFIWALRDAVQMAGYHRSAQETDHYYQRIADEINRACAEGKISCRGLSFNYLDPDFKLYAPHFFESFLKVSKVFSMASDYEIRDIYNTPKKTILIFDKIANRRPNLTNYGFIQIKGWVFLVDNSAVQVILKNRGGQVLGYTEEFHRRSELTPFFASRGFTNVPVHIGFNLNVPKTVKESQLLDAKLVFITQDRKETVVPVQKGAVPDAGINYCIESIRETLNQNHAQNLVRKAIMRVYHPLVIFLTYMGLVALLVFLIFFRSIRITENVYMILFTLAFVIVSRVGLFTLIDASSFPATEVRYLYPVTSLYICTILILVYQAARLIFQRYQIAHSGSLS